MKSQVSEKQGQINNLQSQLDSINSLLAQTNATADKILAGYKAYSGGQLLTGTMVDRGAVSSSLNCGQSYTIPAGYHNGSGKVTANSLASQTVATATADNLSSGVTAWVNGMKITGNGADVNNSYNNGYNVGKNTGILNIVDYKVMRERSYQNKFEVTLDTSSLTGELVVQIFAEFAVGVSGIEVYTPEGFEVESYDYANQNAGYNYLRMCKIEDISNINTISFGAKANTNHVILLQYSIYIFLNNKLMKLFI